MSEKPELDCVSCETTFDPSPTGGFCPDCDTPHPEFGHSTVDDGDQSAEEADTIDDDPEDASSGETSDAGSVDETTGEPTPGTESETPDEPEEESADDHDASSAEPTPEEDDDDAAVSTDDVPTHCPDCGARILGEDEAGNTDDSDVDSEVTDDSDVDSEVTDDSDVDSEVANDSDTDDGVADDGDELTACPDCGRDVSDEAYCPDCGTDLDAHRDQEEDEADRSEEQATEHRETEAVTSDDQVPTDSVTLVVNGERYEIADGDTFGRADEAWLDDLVVASGGSEGVSYVSSEHLAFSFENDGIYVIDQSRNGTMHNGTDLDGDRTRVEDGDYLTLAKRAEIKIEF